MYRSILVRCTGSAADVAVYRGALSLGRRFGAHLTFVHVRLDVDKTIAAMTATDMLGGAWVGDAMESMERDAATLERKASDAVHAFCAAEGVAFASEPGVAGVTAEWLVEIGFEPEKLGEIGRAADLIVLGRQDESGTVAVDVLEAALLDSGRPLLLVAPEVQEVAADVIAIAWKGTAEAARAVTAAMPLIGRAKRVLVFSVDEDNATTGKEPCERLAHSLRWHPAPVEARVLPRDDGPPVETLMTGVRGSGADLLVMGGYTHTRLREMIFGGFTRQVLLAAPVPILMAH